MEYQLYYLHPSGCIGAPDCLLAVVGYTWASSHTVKRASRGHLHTCIYGSISMESSTQSCVGWVKTTQSTPKVGDRSNSTSMSVVFPVFFHLPPVSFFWCLTYHPLPHPTSTPTLLAPLPP